MIRLAAILFVAGAMLAVGSPSPAHADPTPTKQDLDAAKQAFADGKALFDAGKFAEAAEKLKESYRLSHNALLLYNIGRTFDKLGDKDKTLFYFKKFLTDAPATAAPRAEVEKRVAEIEAEIAKATPPDPTPAPDPVPPPDDDGIPVEPVGPFAITHEAVEVIPQGRPHDVVVTGIPAGNYTVVLQYRGSDDDSFVKVPMKPHGAGELVARIPATKTMGHAVQYYIEVRDPSDKVIVRGGKATSPYQVPIERDAKPRCFLDLDAGETATKCAALAVKPPEPVVVVPPDERKWDARISAAKWISTGVTGALVATAVVSYVVATNQSKAILSDSTSCGSPPCRQFDSQYDQHYQSTGTSANSVERFAVIAGVTTFAIAGTLWFIDLRKHHHAAASASAQLAPAVGDGFAGAAMIGRF